MFNDVKRIWKGMSLSEKVNGVLASVFAIVALYAWTWIAAIVQEFP